MNDASLTPGSFRKLLANAAGKTGSQEGGDHQVNLREIFSAVRRGKWIILGALWLCIGAAFAYNEVAKPEYEASTVLFIKSNQAPELQGLSFDTEGMGLANEIAFLSQSIPLAEKVAARLQETGTVPGTKDPLPVLFTASGDRLPTSALAGLLMTKRVTFALVNDRVTMIKVTATSPAAGEASLIANTYAQAYREFNQEMSRASIKASREFLKEQEDKRRQELQQAEARLAAFMRAEGAIALDTEGQLLVERASSVDAEIEQKRLELGLADASLGAITDELERVEPGLAARISSGVESEIGSLQKRIADLEAQANEFYANDPSLRGNESSNPNLAEIHRKIQQFQADLDELSKRYVEEVMSIGIADVNVGGEGMNYVADLKRQIVEKNITMRGLDAQLGVLQSRVRGYESRLSDLPRKSIQYAQLQRDKQAIEQLYLFLGEKVQEASVAEESQLGNVEVVREAPTPVKPVRPQKELNLLLGLLMGLTFGLGLAFVRQALDHRIYQPRDVTKHGVDVAGVVPRFDRIIKAEFKGQERVEVDGRSVSTSLVTLLSPLSPVAECYRGIHTRLQFSRPDKVVQAVLVASAEPQDGKTVSSLNLAITLARAGRRTLYVDADLRRPRGHEVLGVKRRPGLSDLLLGGLEITSEALKSHIEGLFVLPAGKPVPNPAELLGGKGMRDLIEQMRKHFDVIIVDTAPILLATDAVLLATQCDVVLLVVAAAKTTDAALLRMREQLEDVGAPLAGVILNRFDSRSSAGYGYDYGYGDGYQYRYGGYGYREAPPAAKGWFARKEKVKA